MIDRYRRLLSEFIGSAALACGVIGSGIAAATLSPTDTGLALLENAFATALILAVLIMALGPIGGAHFNPAVTLSEKLLNRDARDAKESWAYAGVQTVGCVTGAIVANLMFALPAVSMSTTDRADLPRLLSEVVATAGLVGTIFLLVRAGKAALVAPAVGAYIGAAYFFTSSTSFANPAITVGRMFSDTFAGISPTSVLPFIGAQILGALIAVASIRLLAPVEAIPATGNN